MFVEAKASLSPVFEDRGHHRHGEYSIDYRSAREQIVNTSIEDEQAGYIQVGGFLYTFVSMKDLPDGSFPGIRRDWMVPVSPAVAHAEDTPPTHPQRLPASQPPI